MNLPGYGREPVTAEGTLDSRSQETQVPSPTSYAVTSSTSSPSPESVMAPSEDCARIKGDHVQALQKLWGSSEL